VANFYFEIADVMVDDAGGKYFTTNKNANDNFAIWAQRLMLYSNRVWCEQEGKVWFIKHRHENSPTVDLAEFVWVKLQSKSV
jgi:hypothetical protein